MSLIVRVAHDLDLVYVMSLMRSNREAVGGLPAPAILERIGRGTVLLAEINDDPVGYLLYDLRDKVIRVPQACIQYDARRRRHGVALVQRMLELHEADEVILRCAADLDANIFWRDMGFTCISYSNGGRRRGRQINHWHLWLNNRLFGPLAIQMPPKAAIRQDAMYDDSGFLTEAPKGFREADRLHKLAWTNTKPTEAP